LTGCNLVTGTTSKLHASELNFVYDTKPPTAPVITGSTATNGTAKIAFTVNSDAANVIATTAEVFDGGKGDSVDHPQDIASTGSIKITGLVDNHAYQVTLRFIDAAGNVGPESDSIVVTPIPTHGFWGAYRDAGGFDEGGCSAAPETGASGSSLAWLVMPILALAWFTTMRRASR
jgi:hypothetical protein